MNPPKHTAESLDVDRWFALGMKWIPITEKLPDDEESVLIWCDGEPWTGYVDGKHWHYICGEPAGFVNRGSVVGHKFAVGVADEDGTLRGIAIVGRPVAPRLDDGKAAEITRLCTDGTRNACSMLYGAARRAARALGHEPIYTYTLPEEGGASLRAAGFRLDKEDAGGSAALWHNRPGRTAQPVGDDLVGGKWRWVG